MCDQVASVPWGALGLVVQTPNLSRKIYTIMTHPIIFPFPGFPVPQGG